MNLNDLYRPIGRLYEETPSANYFGDYSAANGWYNVVEDDPAVASAKAALKSNMDLISQYEAEYTDLYKKFGTGCTFARAITSTCRNAVQAKLKFAQIVFGGPVRWLGLSLKGCYKCPGGVLGYEDKKTMEKYLGSLQSSISDLKSKTPALQTAVDKAIADKLKATQASQETVSKNIELEGTKTIEESKQKQTAAELSAKTEQTAAELRAKKIFLAIIASTVLIAGAGLVIFKK